MPLPVTSGEGRVKTRYIHMLPLRAAGEPIHFWPRRSSVKVTCEVPPARSVLRVPWLLKARIAFSPGDPFMTL